MSGLERFERWAADARREAAPRPDVADAVLERLRAEGGGPPDRAGLSVWLAGGLAAAAAAAVAITEASAWTGLFEIASVWPGVVGLGGIP